MPSDGQSGDSFGENVQLSGTTILVGAEEHSAQRGAAYVYDLGPSGWQETAKLVSSDVAIGDEFGTSVGLDGDLAVVSAGKDDDGGTDAGSVYVFTRTAPGTWSQTAKVLPLDIAAHDGFGNPVSIEGTRFLASGRNNDDQGLDSGSAYVFQLLPGGWQQVQKLLPSDGEPGFFFGGSLVLREGVAYIGTDEGPGAAYLFLDPASVSLTGCPPTLSLASGGTQQLRLGASADHSEEIYLLLGSASGTVPGTPLGSLSVPLVLDSYSLFVLNHENQPPYATSLGTLSSSGVALTKLTIPPGASPSLAGTLLFHAQIVFDPLTGAPTFVSNAAPLTLVP